MNTDDGYMRHLTVDDPLRSNEVLVPEEHEEAVVNMSRQQRRAWARKQQKLETASRLESRRRGSVRDSAERNQGA